jgi:ankyrin repeat protein
MEEGKDAEELQAALRDAVRFPKLLPQIGIQSAIQSGDARIVREFLAAGLQPERPHVREAAQSGHAEVLAVLLESRPDLSRLWYYRPALMPTEGASGDVVYDTICAGHEQCARLLLGAWGNVAASQSASAYLVAAAHRGQPSVVDALLLAGIDVDARADAVARNAETADFVCPVYTNATALIIAASEGHVQVVQRLLAAGASVGAHDDHGGTALALAQEHEHAEVVRVLELAGADKMAVELPSDLRLFVAAESGDVEKLRELLAAGADVEARDTRKHTRGATALMVAAAADQPGAIQALCELGADVHSKDSQGYEHQPGHRLAFREGGPDGMRAAGVPLGRTALMYAAERGAVKAANALLAAGADVAAASEFGESPLGIAVDAGHVPMVRALLEAGADPNARLSYKETPLFWAARMKHAMLVRVLIEAGAKVDLKNSDGNTALHEAVAARSLDVVRLLVEAGARAELPNRRKVNVLALARQLKVGPKIMSLLRPLSAKSGSKPERRTPRKGGKR